MALTTPIRTRTVVPANDVGRVFGTTLAYVLTAAIAQVAVALWVPINRKMITWSYFDTSLLDALQPRAFIGTLVDLFGVTGFGFLVLTQGALFFWIASVFLLLAVPSDRGPVLRANLGRVALGLFFAFSCLPYFTNAVSGLVDIFAAAALISAVWCLALLPRDRLAPLLAAVCFMALATLVHERSAFECAMLIAWICFFWRVRFAVVACVLYTGFLAAFALLTAGQASGPEAMSSADYVTVLSRATQFFVSESFNVYGVVSGGGVFLLLFPILAWRFVAMQPRGGRRVLAGAVAVAMLGLCFTPLFIAHDTNRLVASIWLPTLLLLRETDLPARLVRPRQHVVLGFTLALQVMIPPVLIWQHAAVPLNCYAYAVVEYIDQRTQSDPPSLPQPLTLRLETRRADISDVASCFPKHITRPGGDREI